jgi:hypothetical protein
MKMYGGGGDFSTNFILRGKASGAIGYEAEWAQESVWTLPQSGIEIRPARNLVTIPTELSRFPSS